jgi:hypothetical protein
VISFGESCSKAQARPGLGMKLSQALDERLTLLAVLVSEAPNQSIPGVLRKRALRQLLELAIELQIKIGQCGQRGLERRPEMVWVEPRYQWDL